MKDCSHLIRERQKMFLVIERQILRDVAEGVLLEVLRLEEKVLSKSERESLKIIARYADNLARLAE